MYVLIVYIYIMATWRKASISFLMSIVRLFACKDWDSTTRIFMKFDI